MFTFKKNMTTNDALKKREPSSLWSIVCALAFSASTLLSGYGIFLSLSEIAISDIAKFGISVALTSILTLIAFLAWRRVGTNTQHGKLSDWWIVPLFAVTVLLASFVSFASIVTSFSASLFLVQGSAIQAELNAQQSASIMKPILAFQQNFMRLETAVNEVATLSAATSTIEASQGGTCGSTRPGVGPITRLRADQATRGQNYASIAREMAAEARALGQRLSTTSKQADVNDIFYAARNLLTDSRRNDIRTWATNTHDSFSTGRFIWENKVRFCKDQGMVNALAQLLPMVNAVPNLPDSPPQLRPASIFDSMNIALVRIWAVFVHEEDEIVDYTIIPYAVLSLLIDGLGIVSAIALGRSTIPALSLTQQIEHTKIRWAVKHLVWRFEDGKTYYLIPLNGDPQKEETAERMAAVLGLSMDPDFYRVSIAELKTMVPDLSEYFQVMTGHATHANVFSVSPKVRKKMNKMVRKAVLELNQSRTEFTDIPSERKAREHAVKESRAHLEVVEG